MAGAIGSWQDKDSFLTSIWAGSMPAWQRPGPNKSIVSPLARAETRTARRSRGGRCCRPRKGCWRHQHSRRPASPRQGRAMWRQADRGAGEHGTGRLCGQTASGSGSRFRRAAEHRDDRGDAVALRGTCRRTGPACPAALPAAVQPTAAPWSRPRPRKPLLLRPSSRQALPTSHTIAQGLDRRRRSRSSGGCVRSG